VKKFDPGFNSGLGPQLTPPGFEPELTPKEMLEHGVFGGWYFEGAHGEFPKSWLKKAKLSDDGFDISLNCFGIESGQSRAIWQEKGWITVDDPLGWFQWYCRYAMGRRLPGVDDYQIKRWRAFGPRHAAQIRKNCEPGDIFCRRRQRQGLLQWAYDPFI
jgi:hypothetical protein